MLSSHITGFHASYIPYQRHPPCSLFPIDARCINLTIHGVQGWMAFQQPSEPICLGMDVCILSSGTHKLPGPGTIVACCAMIDDWAVYRVELHGALARTILLYVPVIWADVSVHVPGGSRIMEWAKFVWIGRVTPGMLDRMLKREYVPRSIPVWRWVACQCRHSSETITPRSVGYSAA